MGYRLGADIGGTFTDLVIAAPDGGYWTEKLSSTPEDFSIGILEGMERLLAERQVSLGRIDEIVHGTTVATNAVLQQQGARTALITTRGFRDVIELRRMRVPSLYSLLYAPPKPLIERRLRLEVTERVEPTARYSSPWMWARSMRRSNSFVRRKSSPSRSASSTRIDIQIMSAQSETR